MINNVIAPYKSCRILLSKRTQKFLKSAPRKQQLLFLEKLDMLIAAPGLLDIKKLQGYQFLYRIRVSDYRIVFEPDLLKNVIYVVIIAHRKEVYDNLARLKINHEFYKD